jgi:SulP family sulfate permease
MAVPLPLSRSPKLPPHHLLRLQIIGTIESLMTKSVMDEAMGIVGSNTRECIVRFAVTVSLTPHAPCDCSRALWLALPEQVLGLGNIVCGVFGSMGGCALIGTTVINQKSGGVGRLSSFSAGATVLLIILVGYGVSSATAISLSLASLTAATMFGTTTQGAHPFRLDTHPCAPISP